MIQDINIKETKIYIIGENIYAERTSAFFREKEFKEVTTIKESEKEQAYTRVKTALSEQEQIGLIFYFINDIKEMRDIRKLLKIEHCEVFPIVCGGEADITIILLQKTDIRDIEHVPLNYETLFLKVEKLLIRLHMQKRIIESNEANKAFFLKTLKVMAKLLEERDEYTEHHSENVAKIACSIAVKFNFTSEEISKLEIAGLLHDFGKIAVTDKILKKPGKLTAEEYEVIKKHPEIAQVILEPVQDLKEIMPWIKYHHEWWNGKGYPEGIASNEIPFPARILAVADAYDTMHSKRTYHDPYDDDYIRNELEVNRGKQFDPDVVDIFLSILENEQLELVN